jgi:hypothetical protein
MTVWAGVIETPDHLVTGLKKIELLPVSHGDFARRNWGPFACWLDGSTV